MKVYVARHAQTNYNVLGLCNGDPKVDVRLTPKGVQQATKLAAELQQVNFELIITSDFPRTKQTAEIVNKYHLVPTISDSRINDVITGFEGKSAKEFSEARRAVANPWTVRFNGGESSEDEKARVESFLADLKNREEACVLVVTHESVAQFIYTVVNDLPDRELESIRIKNAHYFNFEL